MSYISGLKFFCKMETVAGTNEIDATAATFIGTPTLASGMYGNGLQLASALTASYPNASVNLAITNAFTIGFWLKSKNPGLSTNTFLYPLALPVIAKSGFTGIHTAVSPQFIIWEKTQEDGTNKMHVYLKPAGTAVQATMSTGYAVNTWNHHAFVYDGTATSVKYYLNGVLVETQASMPASLSSSTEDLIINGDAATGNTFDVLGNTGILDEVFITNTVLTVTDIGRAISLGVEYALDTTYQSIEEITKTATFLDQNTVDVNAVLSDDSDVYVGRSDGKLVRGHRTVWQSRVSFGNTVQQNLLADKYGAVGDGTKYSIDNGVLTVKAVIIKL